MLRRGAGGGTRTRTLSPTMDFESTSSTNSNTPAHAARYRRGKTPIASRRPDNASAENPPDAGPGTPRPSGKPLACYYTVTSAEIQAHFSSFPPDPQPFPQAVFRGPPSPFPPAEAAPEEKSRREPYKIHGDLYRCDKNTILRCPRHSAPNPAKRIAAGSEEQQNERAMRHV